ncbi:hypothetical protein GC197_12135 [bacterium]|nr:hypothetical protein [bacterium]
MDASTAIQALSGSDIPKRREAAEACAKNTGLTQAAIVPLCRCCQDEDEQVREWSNAALEESGPPAVDELPALVDLTKAPESTAYWAVTLLGRLQSDGAAALPALVTLIEAPKTPTEVLNRALWAIGQIGEGDQSVRSALEHAAQSENPRTSRLAVSALAKLG